MFLWEKRKPSVSALFSPLLWGSVWEEEERELPSPLHLALSSRSFSLFFLPSSQSSSDAKPISPFLSFPFPSLSSFPIGACPPCSSMGPLADCYCGKTTTRLRCGIEDTGYSCEDDCGRTLSCGLHECEDRCHSSKCPPCPRDQMMVCFCFLFFVFCFLLFAFFLFGSFFSSRFAIVVKLKM